MTNKRIQQQLDWINGTAKAVVDTEETFSQVTDEMKEALEGLRGRASAGKPRTKKRKKPERAYRATFIVDIELVRKVKYIAIHDTRLLREVIADALQEYVSKWEDAHHRINLPKAKRS